MSPQEFPPVLIASLDGSKEEIINFKLISLSSAQSCALGSGNDRNVHLLVEKRSKMSKCLEISWRKCGSPG